MKKLTTLLATLAVLVSLVSFIHATVSAAPANNTKTVVVGIITNNGKAVKNADVTVICKNIARYATTDKNGLYSVNYNKDKCPDGSTVNVTATKKRLGGVGSATVVAGDTRVNLVIVNIAVPEFGVLTGIAALLVGGAAFYFIRRRQNASAQLA